MTLAQAAYREYLQSEHWRGLRMEAFGRYGRKCSRCPATCRLDVHHVRYRRPWTTGKVVDLMILCRSCHEKEHGIVVTVVAQTFKVVEQKVGRLRHRGKWVRNRKGVLRPPDWLLARSGSVKKKWLKRVNAYRRKQQLRASRRSRYQWTC